MKSEFIKQLTQKQQELKQKLAEVTKQYENKISAYQLVINDIINGEGNTFQAENLDYLTVENFSFRETVFRILFANNRFLHKKELVDLLNPNLLTEEQRDKFSQKLSSALTGLQQQGKVVTYGNSKRFTLYGLPEWLSVEGKILLKHYPGKDYQFNGLLNSIEVVNEGIERIA